MSLKIQHKPFDPWAELSAHESILRSRSEDSHSIGATVVFVGSMRDCNEGNTVKSMILEHYPDMAARILSDIEGEARTRWSLQDILLMHRVGQIYPGEPIVLTAAWSAHRKDAFAACRHIMEQLKSTAPFWKQEKLASGIERWVETNTAGY